MLSEHQDQCPAPGTLGDERPQGDPYPYGRGEQRPPSRRLRAPRAASPAPEKAGKSRTGPAAVPAPRRGAPPSPAEETGPAGTATLASARCSPRPRSLRVRLSQERPHSRPPSGAGMGAVAPGTGAGGIASSAGAVMRWEGLATS